MPLSAEQVLSYVRQHGPVVPNDVRQALKAQDNFVVGAILGELSSAGRLKMSDLSYGTSKFYYDPDHPELLERVAKHLNEKDLRAQEMLRRESVLKNDELEPITRLSLTNIPDYARSLRLETPQGDQLYWHYYLVPQQEAIAIIKERWFGITRDTAASSAGASTKTALLAASATDAAVASAPLRSTTPPAASAPQHTTRSPLPVTPRRLDAATPATAGAQPATFGKKVPTKRQKSSEKISAAPSAQSLSVQEPLNATTQAAPRTENPGLATSARPKKTASPDFTTGFAAQLKTYLDSKQIIINQVVSSSKAELSLVVAIPSAVGHVAYYCKAKAKKSVGDGDLAAAALEAQEQKLPLFFIAAGTLSKKGHALVAQLKGGAVVTPWA